MSVASKTSSHILEMELVIVKAFKVSNEIRTR